jgi:TetR/AcrR family transcriptional regulator
MSKPANRPETDPVQKRARAAAVRLFSRHGFEGTSVQAIADEVGTSKQALLYHFSSKEGLRQAAIDEMVETWRTVLPRFLAALTRKQAPFEEALSEILEFFRAEPAYARFLMQELLSGAHHPGITDVSTWLGFAGAYIKQAQSEGLVAAEVDAEAWVVNAGTFILAALSLLDRSELVAAAPAGSPEAAAAAKAAEVLPSEDRVLRELARMIGSSLQPRQGGGQAKIANDPQPTGRG